MQKALTLREKLGYGVADVGASLSYNAINFFFFFFLVNIIGMRPALAGSVLLIGRVFDALTDPLMGLITDRTRSRWGRRMPYIWAGMLPLGASFVLLWLVPNSATVTFWLAIAALCLHDLFFTLVNVPYVSLTPELAPDYSERTALTSYRVGFSTFASLIASAAPPVIVGLLSGSSNLAATDQRSWVFMSIIFGAIITLSYLLMALNVREPKSKRRESQPLNPLLETRTAFAIYGYQQILLLFVVVTIGIGIISSMLPFYLGGSLQLSAFQQTLILGTLFISAILSLPLWSALASRMGKRGAFAIGLIVLSFSTFLLVWFAPPGLSAYLLIMTVIAGLGVGAVLLFPWAMLPDVVEFDELETGKRREGLIYAIFTFAQKIAFAIGVFLNGQVQELSGYVPDAAVQSETALLGIKFMVGPVAAVTFALALVLVWRFPITQEKHAAAKARLAARS